MNNRVFVSGGSKGIGSAIAEKLASENYFVFIGYKSNKLKAEEVVERIRELNGEAKAIYCDVSDRGSIKSAFNETVSIDILINNAAIAQPKPFLEITDPEWEEMLSTNLQGAFRCSQEVIPSMLKNKWGRIINISSIGGQWGGTNQVHYASAKAGLISLTMSLAKMYSNKGITTNAISPGIVKTEMTSWISGDEEKSLINNIPAGRFAASFEIAEVVSFLASKRSSYITGQTINVNGGMLFN